MRDNLTVLVDGRTKRYCRRHFVCTALNDLVEKKENLVAGCFCQRSIQVKIFTPACCCNATHLLLEFFHSCLGVRQSRGILHGRKFSSCSQPNHFVLQRSHYTVERELKQCMRHSLNHFQDIWLEASHIIASFWCEACSLSIFKLKIYECNMQAMRHLRQYRVVQPLQAP